MLLQLVDEEVVEEVWVPAPATTAPAPAPAAAVAVVANAAPGPAAPPSAGVTVYAKGDKIEANFGAKGEYYPGTIAQVRLIPLSPPPRSLSCTTAQVPEPFLHPPPPRSLPCTTAQVHARHSTRPDSGP